MNRSNIITYTFLSIFCCLLLLSCDSKNKSTATNETPTNNSTPTNTEKPVVDKPVVNTPPVDNTSDKGSPAVPADDSNTDENVEQPEPLKSDDGKCYYSEFKGLAKINSIGEAPEEGDNCPDAVLVEFSFGPINATDIKRYKYTLFKDEQQYLTIHGGMNPSKAWLERIGIQEGTILQCSRKELVQGDCSLVVFEFPEIDTDPKDKCK